MTTIPHFGKLSQEQTESLLLQLMEYTSLHDGLNKAVQEVYMKYICGSICVPPQDSLSQDASDIYIFFTQQIENSCLIIQDMMLKRCREAIKNTEL